MSIFTSTHTFVSVLFHKVFFMKVYLLLLSLLSLSLPVHCQESGDRVYWIAQYLSVSYPLRSIQVTSSYGTRNNPFTDEPSVHHGLDLRARNEEVMSMFDGVVKSIGYDDRSGNYVTLHHGEYTVSYCHLSEVLVKEKEDVHAGDVVAISGSTGRSTGPHLHITVKKNGDYFNPYKLLLFIKEVRDESIEKLGANIKAPTRNRSDYTAFFKKYADAAMEQQKKYGIPASVTLAQMVFESGCGSSDLAVRGNNYFGIKCSKEWLKAGKPFSCHDDDRKGEKFCNYGSVMESIEHHSQLLTMSERYKPCRRYASTDYHNWLVAIKRCGYATNPRYVQLLEQVIKQYKLYDYDQLVSRCKD